MAENGSFRNALNGFNKSDVLEYIDAMQSRYANDSAAIQNQVNELQKTIDEQQAEKNELLSKVEKTESEANFLKEENINLKQTVRDVHRQDEEVRRLTNEIEVLRIEKRQYTAEIAEMQELVKSADELKKQLDELRTQAELNSASMQVDKSRIDEANILIENLTNENKNLLNKIDDMQSAAQEAEMSYKQEAEIEINNLKSENQELNTKLEETQKQLEAASKNSVLVGNAGSFIMEMYSMGQHFLEIAYKRSDGCLDSMEESLSALSEQTSLARDKVKNARQALIDYGSLAGLKLDELIQTLETSAGIISDPPASAENHEDVHVNSQD
ncbi:MAG: hypothetical protein PHH84_06865 [Oscillospiraceae bacterium]|nr:hypothetical protein [Oscillospiraceae bacterium]MDD4414828.1 hypothetical protein [Oscillospiraceae bacterium]